jgi:hypothetical protein
MPIPEISGLLLIVAIGWFWLNSIKARDMAMSACRRACDAESLQFLDDTVSAARIRLERDDDGVLSWRRVYRFEYSDTGNNRRPGSIVLLGDRVVMLNIGLRAVPDDRTLH